MKTIFLKIVTFLHIYQKGLIKFQHKISLKLLYYGTLLLHWYSSLKQNKNCQIQYIVSYTSILEQLMGA